MIPLTPMILIVFSNFLSHHLSFSSVSAVQILSKSKLEKCEKVSDSVSLNCSTKIAINMASGGKASIVAEIVKVEEENSTTTNIRTPRIPLVITVNKFGSFRRSHWSDRVLDLHGIFGCFLDSGFSEVDRAECQFTTTATIIDNGSQTRVHRREDIVSTGKQYLSQSLLLRVALHMAFTCYLFGISGIYFPNMATRKSLYNILTRISSLHLYKGRSSITKKVARVVAEVQYQVVVLLWLLHQKGLFDPLHDRWEDQFWTDEQKSGHARKQEFDAEASRIHLKKHHKQEQRHHKLDTQRERRSVHNEHMHHHPGRDADYHYYLHHVHKDKLKSGRIKGNSIMQQIYIDKGEDGHVGHCRRRKDNYTVEGKSKITTFSNENPEDHYKNKHVLFDEKHFELHAKRRE
ncbi:Protein HAPLESS 2 like [Actinidia chinensis var. chinensis]|uniref:Protein HAPLESS 2 like n=1 Tax=Actinidia chinensis var. chinensis TaxID=1590841 RepID=A0A2R6PI11_ACTCC|nr:Protein HAPLESS 2 like [Actinidia chinensis var. chinensis]